MIALRLSAGVLGIPPSVRGHRRPYALPKEPPRRPKQPSLHVLKQLLKLSEEHLSKVETLLKAMPTDELLDREAKLHALIEQIMAQLAERGR